MLNQNPDIEKDFLGYLPSLPKVAAEFIELTRELNTSKNSYANFLLSDPVLSTRIFSYINLVLNPSNTGYLSINKGISIMGLHKFKNLVMAFSLFPVFQEADSVELYKYSLLTAYYSKAIASHFNLINPHDAFLLGFLHDIGKLALKNKFRDKYSDTVSCDDDEPVYEYSPEEEIADFNYCHADISEYICRKWSLPVVVADAIKFHHFPLDAMLPQAASVVYLSDLLAHKNTRFTKESQKVFQYMQLSKSDLLPHADISLRKVQPFFEILNI